MGRPNIKLIILLVVITLIYGISLNQVPVHFNQDELGFALNAYSVAKTGFDENGRFFPLYFWHLGLMWATPIIVYLTTLFLVAFPLSEVTVRLPAVLVGLTDIVLIYFLARMIFRSENFGLLSATLLAIIPVHFIQSRILLDNLFIVPFVLGWLIFLWLFIEKKNLWFLFWAGLILGIGIHSYHAAKVMMSFYLLLTLLFTVPEILKKKWILLLPIIGFVLPILPLIPWLSKYPDTLTDQVKYTGLYDIHLSPLQGVISLLTPESIANRLSIFLSYFNPQFLFFKGDASLIHSTQKVGVFLLAFVILLPLGIYQYLKTKKRFNLLLVVGFLTAPLAPALVGNQYRVSKELVILPFAAIIATKGLQFLLNSYSKTWQWLASLLLLAAVLQFTYFLSDYFTDYRVRSYGWFNYNIPGALEKTLEEDQKISTSGIYLDHGVYFIDRYWRFYLIKHHQEDVVNKTHYIDPTNFSLPANILLLLRYDHTNLSSVPKEVIPIVEPDQAVSFYLYRQ